MAIYFIQYVSICTRKFLHIKTKKIVNEIESNRIRNDSGRKAHFMHMNLFQFYTYKIFLHFLCTHRVNWKSTFRRNISVKQNKAFPHHFGVCALCIVHWCIIS